MIMSARNLTNLGFALFASTSVLLLNDRSLTTKDQPIIENAHAVRGRPATPLSYAGVARRTTRRAYPAGAASGVNCARVAGAYGGVATRCY
jgi:hypothetical protein